MSKILLLQLLIGTCYVGSGMCIYRMIRSLARFRFLKFALIGLVFGLFAYATFRERFQLKVEYKHIDIGVEKRVVLISDTHLGIFKDWVWLQKVVNRINRIKDVDMVLIAGDLTYWPTDDQYLEELFLPFGDLDMPVFMVLGNHDVEKPGPDLRLDLVRALEKQDITFLNNDVVQFDDFFLVGLGSHFNHEDNVSLLDEFHVVNNVVVLTHNPDTVNGYRNYNADLTLAGHTHCGQIRLPWIHERLRPYIYPVDGPRDCGLYNTKRGRVYITPGVGEVMLPMRFRIPPTISVLDLGEEK